ncbi:hypothetical protein IV454_26555 [Massilia antarctica]|uniref:DUF4124 domain-containing protein n=1 Tax=Massilia antarctica TaxID=2765360 RepID=A0AA48WCF6_9BURK|nr:hypothetical protein [Massilia antarctica]QPI49004.1 hypothetical protein IV454_26555 [Massilia antarctica]
MLAKKLYYCQNPRDIRPGQGLFLQRNIHISMHTRPLYLALILATLSTGAHAGLNKCKGANGHFTFQNAACDPPNARPARMPTLAERNALSKQQRQQDQQKEKYADDRPGANWDPARKPGASLPPMTPPQAPQASAPAAVAAKSAPASAPKAAPGAPVKSEYEQKMAAEKVESDKAKTRASNKAIECSNARQQLAGLSRDGRVVQSVDKKGERNYLADDKRGAAVAEAERSVARACN